MTLIKDPDLFVKGSSEAFNLKDQLGDGSFVSDDIVVSNCRIGNGAISAIDQIEDKFMVLPGRLMFAKPDSSIKLTRSSRFAGGA